MANATASTDTNTDTATEEPEVVAADATCDRIIRNHVYISMGVGLIPLPLVDIVALSGVQIDMVRKMSEAYGVEFSRDVTKATIASVLGASTSVFAAPTLSSLLKVIPGVGSYVGGVSRSIFSGAATYAVGKLFQQHFASGGTMLDLNPTKMREYFRGYFAEGKKVAKEAEETVAA